MRDIVPILAWLNDNFQVHKRNFLLWLIFSSRDWNHQEDLSGEWEDAIEEKFP
jgi:hypothetical protein